MLRSIVAGLVDGKRKRALKAKLHQAKLRLVRALRSYGPEQLKAELRRLGIAETDTLFVHSNFEPLSGFTGTPNDVVEAFATLVGSRGNLLMVSIPFRGAAYDHLAQNKTFDVRKAMSMMGLITEIFRRRVGTQRSLHPTHPVLAIGVGAARIVAGHEHCPYPCGPGTPFEKFHALNGKIVFFDVGFGSITFFHYVEHLVMKDLPFPVYEDQVFETPVIDAAGERRTVKTQAYSRGYPRAAEKLEAEMKRRGMLQAGRVGNSRILIATAADVVEAFSAMVKAGNYPYHLTTT